MTSMNGNTWSKLVILPAIGAFITSVKSLLSCNFMHSDFTSSSTDPTLRSDSLGLGMYSRQGLLTSNQDSCKWYNTSDRLSLSDKMFSISVISGSTSAAFGLFTLLFISFAACKLFSTNNVHWYVMALTFLTASVTGLSFIWFAADYCDVEQTDCAVDDVYCLKGGCSLGTGGILSIVSGGLWLVCCLITWVVAVYLGNEKEDIRDLGLDEEEQVKNDGDDDANTDIESVASSPENVMIAKSKSNVSAVGKSGEGVVELQKSMTQEQGGVLSMDGRAPSVINGETVIATDSMVGIDTDRKYLCCEGTC